MWDLGTPFFSAVKSRNWSSCFPRGSSGKKSTCNAGDVGDNGFNSWVEKIPWRRKWQATQYSHLGNPIGRGAWWAIVHGVTKTWTQLSEHVHTHTHTHTHIFRGPNFSDQRRNLKLLIYTEFKIFTYTVPGNIPLICCREEGRTSFESHELSHWTDEKIKALTGKIWSLGPNWLISILLFFMQVNSPLRPNLKKEPR